VKTSHYLIASLGGARERSVPLLKEEKRGTEEGKNRITTKFYSSSVVMKLSIIVVEN